MEHTDVDKLVKHNCGWGLYGTIFGLTNIYSFRVPGYYVHCNMEMNSPIYITNINKQL
jgi:hypothetical protein